MDAERARQVLGLQPASSAAEVRAAFRALVREHHPDISGDSRLATTRTAELIEAYRTLLRAGADKEAHPAPPAPAPTPTSVRGEVRTRTWVRGPGVRVTVDNDTIGAAVPSNELFTALFEAAHELGEVAYTDRSIGLLEIIVEFEGGPVCSVLLTLQGRAAGGVTEAFVTVEPLTQEDPPPAAAVARLVASRLRAHLR